MRKNYTFKIYKSSEVALRLSTHSIRRFLTKLRTLTGKKTYLRVSYGGGDVNEGYYQNKQELLQAFNAFNERGNYES